MAKIKSKIKQAIFNWNQKNPTLRKKTLSTIAEELGISVSALSQIESSPQFQKHLEVILDSKIKFEQKTCFELYKKVDIPIINKLSKIIDILDCEIYDVVGLE